MGATYILQRWIDYTFSGGDASWVDEPGCSYHKPSAALDAMDGLARANAGTRYRVLRVEVVREAFTPRPDAPPAVSIDKAGPGGGQWIADLLAGFAEQETPFLKPAELDRAFRAGSSIAAGVCPDCGSEIDHAREDLVKCKGCHRSWKRATLAPFGVGWFR